VIASALLLRGSAEGVSFFRIFGYDYEAYPQHIGFTEIQTFDLRISLGHKSGFVPCHHTMLILLVAEDSLGSYNILVRTWN
jgi:hypothetical protein